MHSETDLIIPDKGKLYEETKAKKKKKKKETKAGGCRQGAEYFTAGPE